MAKRIKQLKRRDDAYAHHGTGWSKAKVAKRFGRKYDEITGADQKRASQAVEVGAQAFDTSMRVDPSGRSAGSDMDDAIDQLLYPELFEEVEVEEEGEKEVAINNDPPPDNANAIDFSVLSTDQLKAKLAENEIDFPASANKNALVKIAEANRETLAPTPAQ